MMKVSTPFFVLFLLILSAQSLQANPFNEGEYDDMAGLAAFAKTLFQEAHTIDFESPVASAPPAYGGKDASLYPVLSPYPTNNPGVATSKINSIWSDLFYFVVESRKYTGVFYEKGDWFYNFPELEDARDRFLTEAGRADESLLAMKTKMTQIANARDNFRVMSDALAETLAPPAMARPRALHQRNVSQDFQVQCLEGSQTLKASSDATLRVLNQKITALECLVQEQQGIKEINDRAVSILTGLMSTKSEGAAPAIPLTDRFLHKEAEGSGPELKELFGVALPGQESELATLYQVYISVVRYTEGFCDHAGLTYRDNWKEFITQKRPRAASISTPEMPRKGPGADIVKKKRSPFKRLSNALFASKKSSGGEGSPGSERRDMTSPYGSFSGIADEAEV